MEQVILQAAVPAKAPEPQQFVDIAFLKKLCPGYNCTSKARTQLN